MNGSRPPDAMPPDTETSETFLTSTGLSLETAIETPLPASSINNTPQKMSHNGFLAMERDFPSSPVDIGSSSARLARESSPILPRKTSTSSLRNTGSTTPKTPRRSLSRRGSSNAIAGSPTIASKSPLPAMMEGSQLTAASIAADHFRDDLELHDKADEPTETIVILHDSCYGHRYSRPKTSKATLNTIVERPERILAGVLGISAAYVRLRGAHSGENNAPHPERKPAGPLPFKIVKTKRTTPLTSAAVTAVHGTKWMQELKTMCDTAGWNLATTGKELARPVEPNARLGQSAKEKLHEGDLYLCTESLDAMQGAISGVLDAVDAVFEGSKQGGPTRAFSCIRPPGHHCSADYPSGFCWLNNVHVGIAHAAQKHGLTHAAIIDFDLHHGDGSQAITWDHNAKVAALPKSAPSSKKTSIGYFSIHDINSYPCEYGDPDKVQKASLCLENAHGQSIWNVHLQPWKTEAEFWELYEEKYRTLLEKARSYLKTQTERLKTSSGQVRPKAAIFISAGFDASEWEGQGMQRHKVNVPTEFYARFTRDIVSMSSERDTAVEERVISVLEGGYSDRALTSGIMSHLCGLSSHKSARKNDRDSMANGVGLGVEMNRRIASLSLEQDKEPDEPTYSENLYDPDWWHSSRMSELELVVYPAPAPNAKLAKANASTFASATQSSNAKTVDPARIRRTASGMLRQASGSPSRPPPPEVEWTVASHELSKLLIPTDRLTTSCKPEELTAVRVKKERQSIAPAPADSLPGGRQLRVRKGKAPAQLDGVADGEASAAPRKSNRRRTIADLPKADADKAESRPQSRRVSMASDTSSISAFRAGATDRPRRRSSAASQLRAEADSNRMPGVKMQNDRRPAASSSQSGSRSQAKPAIPPVPPLPSAAARSATRGGAQSQAGAEDKDLEQLTSKLKRITIKVPPKKEYEARAAKPAAETEKKRGPARSNLARTQPPASRVARNTVAKKAGSTRSSSTTPKPSARNAGPQASTPIENVPTSLPENGQPVPTASSNAADVDPDAMVIEPIAGATRPSAESAISSNSAESGAQFVAFDPTDVFTVPATSATPTQPQTASSLQWLPPNSDVALPESIRHSSTPGDEPAKRRTRKSLPASANGEVAGVGGAEVGASSASRPGSEGRA